MRWERNLPPAVVGLLRGVLWAVALVVIEAIIALASPAALANVPPWAVGGIPAVLLALRTFEGLIDHALAKDPLPSWATALLPGLESSLEGLLKRYVPAVAPPAPGLTVNVGSPAPASTPPAPMADPSPAPQPPQRPAAELPPTPMQPTPELILPQGPGVIPLPGGVPQPSPTGATPFVPPGQFPR